MYEVNKTEYVIFKAGVKIFRIIARMKMAVNYFMADQYQIIKNIYIIQNYNV